GLRIWSFPRGEGWSAGANARGLSAVVCAAACAASAKRMRGKIRADGPLGKNGRLESGVWGVANEVRFRRRAPGVGGVFTLIVLMMAEGEIDSCKRRFSQRGWRCWPTVF